MTAAPVLRDVDELVHGLAKYRVEVGREVEVIVRDDGTAALMVGDESGGSFEEVRRFKSMEELWSLVECRR